MSADRLSATEKDVVDYLVAIAADIVAAAGVDEGGPTEIGWQRTKDGTIYLRYFIALGSGTLVPHVHEIDSAGRYRALYDREMRRIHQQFGHRFTKVRRGDWTDEGGWRGPLSPAVLAEVGLNPPSRPSATSRP